MKMVKPLCIIIAASILISAVLVQEYKNLYINETNRIIDQTENEFTFDLAAVYFIQLEKTIGIYKIHTVDILILRPLTNMVYNLDGRVSRKKGVSYEK